MTQSNVITGVVSPPRQVLRQHGRSFHFASHILGPRHADRGARLYAFCRHLDDLADEATDIEAANTALATTRFALNTGYARDPVVTDFIALASETDMPLQPALHLIDGLQQDLKGVALTSKAELIRYAYRVAGTVGLMMCCVLDTHTADALPHAVDLGIAMQLTNIARDIGEDARMGRRYIPGPWIDNASAQEIQEPSPALQTRLKAATKRLLELADRYYASGEAGLHFLPARARLAILVASRVYGAIGQDIAQHDYQSWDRRARVSGPKKGRLALGSVGAFLATDRLKRLAVRHDPHLHDSLKSLMKPHDARTGVDD